MSNEVTERSAGSDRGFSRTVAAEKLVMGDVFEADHFNHSMWLDGRMSPIVMVDHFRMYHRTFQEHPHAGISAVTLMLEDSPGEMRSIDSLGLLSQFGPGDLHWTLAGRGVTHNQFPLEGPEGSSIHALQIFVKLPEPLEDSAPSSYKVAATEMPRFVRGGVQGRVVLGALDGLVSGGRSPQELLFLDLWATDAPGHLDVAIAPGWNVVTIPITGEVRVRLAEGEGEALGLGMAHADTVGSEGVVSLSMEEGSHVVVLAGQPDDRPVYSNGPFAYGSAEGLAGAVMRYERGNFGTCPPMPPPGVPWND